MGYIFENINPKTLSSDIALGVQFPMNYPAVFNSTYTTLEAVKTNIKNLLLTRKGERVMHPNFGSDLLSIIFEPNVSELKGEIQQIISDPISLETKINSIPGVVDNGIFGLRKADQIFIG